MKIIHILLLAATLASCQSSTNTTQHTQAMPIDTVSGTDTTSISDAVAEDEYMLHYLIIADTGTDYLSLRNKMQELHLQTGLKIDTMNRYYNTDKHKLILREDDEDELYAGEYFLRRVASPDLSIEYLDAYSKHTTNNTFAIVAGLYTNRAEADSVLPHIRSGAPSAYVLPASIFMGCMH